MFFVLSKTVSFLLMPLTLVMCFLLASAFLRKAKLKRLFFWLGAGLLIFFSNEFIANEVMSAWEVDARPFDSVPRYKLAIVLTGTTAAKMEPDDRVYFNKGADRVTHTVQLYKRGLVEHILISGGTGALTDRYEPEANKYRKVMIMMGVDSSHIMLENQTRNTYESAVAVKPMLERLGYTEKDCVLITSAFHIRRSLACYRKAGLVLDSFPTDFYSHPRDVYPDSLLVPKVDALLIWQKLFKEWLGFAAYKVAGYV